MEVLSTAQAAKFVNMSPRTLERWRLTGGGPRYLKLGRAVRYRKDDLEQFLAESRRSSTSDSGPEAA